MNILVKNILGGDFKSALAYYLGILWSLPVLFFELFYSFSGAFSPGTAIRIFALALPSWFYGIYCLIQACMQKKKSLGSILHALVPTLLGFFTFFALIAILIIRNYIIR